MAISHADTICLPTWMQQCVLVEASTNSSIHLFNMYLLRAYYVPVTSTGARSLEETYIICTVGVMPRRGSWGDSEMAYVINQSYYSYSYW